MVKLIQKPWMWLVRGWRKKEAESPTIGVLTFEISRLMARAISLWLSLDEERIAGLRDETLRLNGLRKLVSDDDEFLLSLALAEIMESVHFIGKAVVRLGSGSVDPILLRFESVFSDLVKNKSDFCGLEFSRRRMNREVRRMEKFVAASSDLYQELDLLGNVEIGVKRQVNPGRILEAYKRRVIYHRQTVKHLQEISVWNRSQDYVARLLARALFTILAKIKLVFGLQHGSYGVKSTGLLSGHFSMSGGLIRSSSNFTFASGPLMAFGKRRGIFGPRTASVKINHDSTEYSGSESQAEFHNTNDNEMGNGEDEEELHLNLFTLNSSLALLDLKSKFLNPPASTVGGAAVAFHYANLIILIESLLESPNSISSDTRDDLYSMLPSSVKASLRIRLRSYAKNLRSSFYDQNLAGEWSDAVERILEWLVPLAHNTVEWQSERGFGRQFYNSGGSVLLVHTLYYADLKKTESAITELLIGLNYLWRYGKELSGI